MSEKQKEFIEGIKDLNKYSFDIIDKTLIEDTNIEAVLPCNKCDGDCCGIVPFKREHIIHIFNKYTDSKKCSKDVFSAFKKKFPYSSETSLKKNLEFKAFMGELDSIVVEFKDKNKFKKMGFDKVDCIFKKDPKSGGCLIYEDRPLICRAYGKKKSLQCPYSGLDEQPKDEAIKKSKIMANNSRMLDSIDEMTIKNRIYKMEKNKYNSFKDLIESLPEKNKMNPESNLAKKAVEYFKGREDIIEDRMKDLQENGAAALMSDETFSKILEAKEKELKVSKIFIWENMGDTQKEIFEDWFKETFEIDCKYLTENKGSILFSITNEVLENLDAIDIEDLYSRFTIFGIRLLEVAENIELTK